MKNCYFFAGGDGVIHVDAAQNEGRASPQSITIFRPLVTRDLFGNIKQIRDLDTNRRYYPAPDGRRLQK